VVAPAKTPREIIVRLNQEIGKGIQQRTTRERMLASDFQPTSTTPEQFGSFIKSEVDKWGKVVKASGARAD
jgi:tripartite-type tricarboxylate transporter receptor subunit TctC